MEMAALPGLFRPLVARINRYRRARGSPVLPRRRPRASLAGPVFQTSFGVPGRWSVAAEILAPPCRTCSALEIVPPGKRNTGQPGDRSASIIAFEAPNLLAATFAANDQLGPRQSHLARYPTTCTNSSLNSPRCRPALPADVAGSCPPRASDATSSSASSTAREEGPSHRSAPCSTGRCADRPPRTAHRTASNAW